LRDLVVEIVRELVHAELVKHGIVTPPPAP
jgi:hypothetical protein